jgi:hypothetical protein
MREGARSRMKEMTDRKDRDVTKKHGFDSDCLEKWLEKYGSDPRIKECFAQIKSMEDQLFDEQVVPIDYHLPEGLTKEKYLQIIRKVLAIVRYKYHPMAQEERIKGQPSQPIDENVHNELINKIDPEEFRDKVLALYGIKIDGEDTAKRVMQRCYIKYSTGADGAKWNKEIDYEQKVHAEILERLRNGQKVNKIEEDPLLSTDNEYAIDYSNMPGFQGQESMNDSKFKVQPSEKSVQYVQKML